MKRAGHSVLNPDFSPAILSRFGDDMATVPSQTARPIHGERHMQVTLGELRTQAKDKPWFVVDGEVYDGTGYLSDHPGGESSILLVAGEDASEDFGAIHSDDARARLSQVSIVHLPRASAVIDRAIRCEVPRRKPCSHRCP